MNKKALHITSIISLVLAVLVMIMIFVFSSETGEKSTQTSGAVVETVIDITVPNYDTLPETEKQEIKRDYTHVIRKLAHFTEFMLLGLFLMLHVKSILTLRNKKWMFDFLYVTLFGFLYALSDEFHQSFSDGRGPQFIDSLIDTTGVITGVLAITLIWFIATKIVNKKIQSKGE